MNFARKPNNKEKYHAPSCEKYRQLETIVNKNKIVAGLNCQCINALTTRIKIFLKNGQATCSSVFISLDMN